MAGAYKNWVLSDAQRDKILKHIPEESRGSWQSYIRRLKEALEGNVLSLSFKDIKFLAERDYLL